MRRVSLVSGEVEAAGGSRTPRRFADADWELVSSTGRPDELDALRFRPRRPRPAGGSAVRVSYWPRDVPPVPLTDLGVGSVTRTVLETLARELADAEAQLQVVYDSAFVDTAARPRPEGARLALAMGARYLPLPRADAATMHRAVSAVQAA